MTNGIRQTTSGVAETNSGVVQTRVSSGPSLPPSARNQWPIQNTSGTNIPDVVGSSDATLNGANRVTGANYYNGVGISSSGTTSQYINLGLLGNFGSSLNTDFAIGLTFRTTTSPSNSQLLFGQSSSDGSGGISGDATTLGLVANSDTDMEFRLKDQDKDKIKVETSSLDSTFSDGNFHRYLFNKTSNSASGLEIYQDGVQQATSGSSSGTFNNVINFDLNGVQLLRQQFNGGFTTDPIAGTVDNIIIYDSALSQAEIQDDFDLQPWS